MSELKPIKGWTDIKQEDTSHFQSYLSQVSAVEQAKLYKQKTFDAMVVQPGQRILDVGCGNGDDVRTLARLVGATGQVVGVDSHGALIEGAQQSQDNNSLPIQFVAGDGHQLEFAEGTFDAARADRVLQHVHDPQRVLAEMVRVTRSGGSVVVADPDWGTLVVDHPGDRALTRKILNYICDHYATNGWMGRQSYRRLKLAGLHNVSAEVITGHFTDFSTAGPILHLVTCPNDMVQAGELSADEAADWLESLRQADQQDHFFCGMSMFIVRGQKP